MARVQGALDQKNVPFKLTYVNLRSRNFDDADLRAAAAEAEVQLQRENDRIAAANARAKAVEAETVALEALRSQVTLKMESISKVVNVTDGISCTELALLDSPGCHRRRLVDDAQRHVHFRNYFNQRDRTVILPLQ